MARSAAGKRPQLVPVSEEMAHMCALLAQELLRWLDVRERSMFGLRAFYRGAAVFAMLPEKRALEDPRSISYKLADGSHRTEGEKWQGFELNDEHDVDHALARLATAYRKAARPGRTH